eukprot:gene1255-4464_t
MQNDQALLGVYKRFQEAWGKKNFHRCERLIQSLPKIGVDVLTAMRHMDVLKYFDEVRKNPDCPHPLKKALKSLLKNWYSAAKQQDHEHCNNPLAQVKCFNSQRQAETLCSKYIEDIGDVPFEVIEPALFYMSPRIILKIEEKRPEFIEKTNHIWRNICQHEFPRHFCKLDAESRKTTKCLNERTPVKMLPTSHMASLTPNKARRQPPQKDSPLWNNIKKNALGTTSTRQSSTTFGTITSPTSMRNTKRLLKTGASPQPRLVTVGRDTKRQQPEISPFKVNTLTSPKKAKQADKSNKNLV